MKKINPDKMQLKFCGDIQGAGAIRPEIAFPQSPSFIFGTPAQGSTSSPEIDPVRVKYLYQTRTDGGGLVPPPTPRKRPPPLKKPFSVLVQGRAVTRARPAALW